jgi:cell division protein FtsL
MARRTSGRVNSGSVNYRVRQTYEDGNAVRKLYAWPEEEPKRQAAPKRTTSLRVQKNRMRARNMGVGYVLFLSAVCVASLFFCINYLQVKSAITMQNETIAGLESQLSQLKDENDAYYDQVLNSVTLDDVKNAALNRLGLHYASASQIQYYDTAENSYVRQYQDVPDTK